MAVAVTINGTNRISNVLDGSLTTTRTAGARNGRCSFVLKNLIPNVGETLVIADGAVSYFNGTVKSVGLSELAKDTFLAAVDGQDAGAAASTTVAPFGFSDRTPALTYAGYISAGGANFASWESIGLRTPLAWWRFGEASGTTADDEKNYQDGTYVGTPTLGVSGAFTGITNTAVTLDGSTQWIEVGNKHLLGATDYAFSCWIKTTYKTSDHGLYYERKAAGGWPVLVCYMNTSGRPVIFIGNDSGVTTTVAASSGDWADGNWHLAVFAKTGTALAIYMDGVSVASGTLSGAQTYTGTILARIGRDPAATGTPWTGSLDEAMIFTGAFTAQMAQELSTLRDVRPYVTLTAETVDVEPADTTTGTVTTLAGSGLAPGQITSVSCDNYGWIGLRVKVTEVVVKWLNATTPLYTARLGDPWLTLAATYP